MKLHEQKNTIKSSGLENVHTKFNIQSSRKMFNILSDKMYSNKPQAILRELGANCRDAHQEAGKENVPFRIVLPTQLQPTLTIQDFGTGLSHSAMMTLIPSYGGTTKDMTNELIGGLGLGSKSPFSYTDSYVMVSVYDREKRTYNCYMEKGEPAVTLVGQAEYTDEENGITYLIPVNPSDINDFVSEARKVYTYYETLPEIKNGPSDFKIESISYETRNDLFGVRSNTTQYSYSYRRTGTTNAIMGTIAYPVDFDAIKTEADEDRVMVRHFSNLGGLDLFFDIGDLDIAASRESLSYDKETQALLVDRMREIQQTMLVEVEKKVAKAKTKWAATILMSMLSNTLEYVAEDNRKVMWYGHTITNRLSFIGQDITFSKRDGDDRRDQYQSKYPTLSITSVDSHDLSLSKLSLSNKWISTTSRTRQLDCRHERIIRATASDHRQPSRLLRWAKEKFGSRNISMLIIECADDATFDMYVHQVLGNPRVYTFEHDIPDYSLLERKANKAAGITGKSSGLYKLKNWVNYSPMYAWEKDCTVDVDAESGFYVDVRRHNIHFNDNTVDPHSFDRFILATAKRLKLVEDDVVIYGCSGSKKNTMKDHKNWVNIIDHIHQKARYAYQKQDSATVASKKAAYEYLVDPLGHYDMKLIEDVTPARKDGTFAKAQKVYLAGKDIEVNTDALDILQYIDRRFEKTFIKKVHKSTNKYPLIRLAEHYPLFDHIDTYGHSDERIAAFKAYVDMIDALK